MQSPQLCGKRGLWFLLWTVKRTFEKEAEFDIHNYLEHLIMKHGRDCSSDSGLIDNAQAD